MVYNKIGEPQILKKSKQMGKKWKQMGFLCCQGLSDLL